MKKYFVYLMMALAAFTFNACGDDDPVTEQPGTEQPGTPDDPNDNSDDSDEPEDPNDPAHLRETATSLWPISVGAEPHSGWHNRLWLIPEQTCSA